MLLREWKFRRRLLATGTMRFWSIFWVKIMTKKFYFILVGIAWKAYEQNHVCRTEKAGTDVIQCGSWTVNQREVAVERLNLTVCSKHICCLFTYVYAHGHILVHMFCCLKTVRTSFETCPMPVRKCHMPGASVCFAVANPWHKSSDFWMPVSFGSVFTSVVVLISTSKICSMFKSLLSNLNVPSANQAESPSLSCCF